jgi:hypothetical protein
MAQANQGKNMSKNLFKIRRNGLLTITYGGEIVLESPTILQSAIVYGRQHKSISTATKATAATHYIMEKIAAHNSGLIFNKPLWQKMGRKTNQNLDRKTNPDLIGSFTPLHKYFCEVFETEALRKGVKSA